MNKLKTCPLDIEAPDFSPLLKKLKDKSIVMIGEASHGTEEFYHIRAELTKKLITDHDFSAVAIEGDWPDTYRVNRFVKGLGEDSAKRALGDYQRFPLWMWRNEVMLDFVSWLREFNSANHKKAGIFGLDLYGLNNSIHRIIGALEKIDPEAASAAIERYSCLDFPLEDGQSYGEKVFHGVIEHCKDEVLEQLIAMRREFRDKPVDSEDEDGNLNLELNALGVVGAESYYRELYEGSASTWNIRDGHMMKCLEILKKHEAKKYGKGKVIVWAHNSHVGDASSHHRAHNHETTLGELARERYPEDVFLIGMTTYTGSVTAADKWGEEAEYFRVNNALENSHAAFLKSQKTGNYMLDTKDDSALDVTRLERAIGVIYRPATERYSHYFQSKLSKRFDWMMFIEKTSALRPLDSIDTWRPKRGIMDTFPTGL